MQRPARLAAVILVFTLVWGFNKPVCAVGYRSLTDSIAGNNLEHAYRCKKKLELACFLDRAANNAVAHKHHTDIALMNFFGGLDTSTTLPGRATLSPRNDDRSTHICRTLGDFAVYMHDFGLKHFDVNFRKDVACWNGSDIEKCFVTIPGVERGYTWWCNKRPNNPCVFNCPTQVREVKQSLPLVTWQSSTSTCR